jgi:hypothetical protein
VRAGQDEGGNQADEDHGKAVSTVGEQGKLDTGHFKETEKMCDICQPDHCAPEEGTPPLLVVKVTSGSFKE